MADKMELQDSNKRDFNKRDMTLVKILERMIEQLQAQDTVLKEFIDCQTKISSSVDNNVYKYDLFRDEVDFNINKLHDSFNRYRSDMLSFIREQDIIEQNSVKIHEKVSKIGYSMEDLTVVVSDIEKRLSKHEKEARNNIDFTDKKWKNISDDLSGTNRNIASLHADVDNSFKQVYANTDQLLEKYQKHTTKRLLALDDMMTALETLLIRTEPPEKKSPILRRIFRFIKRLLKKIGKFFNTLIIKLKT